MLVLTRKLKQSVMVGDDVEITVLAVQGDKVRLGINAPADIAVFRTEIYREIERERGARSDADSRAEHAPSGQHNRES